MHYYYHYHYDVAFLGFEIFLIILVIRLVSAASSKKSKSEITSRSSGTYTTMPTSVSTYSPTYTSLADAAARSPRVAHSDADLSMLKSVAADQATPASELEVLAANPRLAAIVAANPSTATVVLERLSATWDVDVWRAVEANPNTDRDTLLRLAPTYPGEFFANPIVPLLLLEQPDMLLHCHRKGLMPLVRHPHALPVLLAILANHFDTAVASEARLHVALAGELSAGDWPYVADGEMWQVGLYNADDRLCLVIDDGAVPHWLVPPLILHGNEDVRLAVAFWAGAPRHILSLMRLAGARRDLVGYAAADPRVSIDDLERLVRGGAWARGLVARHPSSPPGMLSRLAADVDANVRSAVARHRATPAIVLSSLSDDTSVGVRKEVAYNPQTPPHALERLAGDPRLQVRSRVARNTSVPDAVLVTLAQDADWQVRRWVALNSSTSLGILRQLAADSEPRVRFEVARHGSLTDELIDEIARNADSVVSRILRRRNNSLGAVGARLAVTRGPAMAADVPAATREDRPPPMSPAAASASAKERHALMVEALIDLLRDDQPDPVQRAIALANPALPSAYLSSCLHADNWIERFAVARNPAAPAKLLQILSVDANRLVRAAAYAHVAFTAE